MYILNKRQQFKDGTFPNGILGKYTKNTDILVFLFEWLKRDWQPYDCCLHRKLFYLSTLSRITLYHLRLIFWDALRDLIPFVQFKKREKHSLGIITFSNTWKYNNTRNTISFSVCKFFFIFLKVQFLANESPLKIMKNAFYFTSKTLFVLKIFKFLSWLFVHLTNGLIRRIRLVLKFTTSQPG